MKINSFQKLILVGLLIFSQFSVHAVVPFMQTVITEGNGRVCQYAVILQEIKLKTNPKVTYFWHRNGQLRSTKGDFSGNILHGDYQEFDKSGRLLEKGVYYYGSKDGEWKSWNKNGEIIKIEKWRRGFLNQKTYFNHPGYIVENYKQNKLQGHRIVNNNGQKDLIEHYRNGVKIEKKRKSIKSIILPKKQKNASNVVNNK